MANTCSCLCDWTNAKVGSMVRQQKGRLVVWVGKSILLPFAGRALWAEGCQEIRGWWGYRWWGAKSWRWTCWETHACSGMPHVWSLKRLKVNFWGSGPSSSTGMWCDLRLTPCLHWVSVSSPVKWAGGWGWVIFMMASISEMRGALDSCFGRKVSFF